MNVCIWWVPVGIALVLVASYCMLRNKHSKGKVEPLDELRSLLLRADALIGTLAEEGKEDAALQDKLERMHHHAVEMLDGVDALQVHTPVEQPETLPEALSDPLPEQEGEETVEEVPAESMVCEEQDNLPEPVEPEPEKMGITWADEKLINHAMKYVEDNMARSDLSVEELSHELGMSRVNLYKKLVALTGKTPIEFIRVIRLKRAAELLRQKKQNVSEIAYLVGFNNPKYFSKYFKEEYGVLPSAYQNREINN